MIGNFKKTSGTALDDIFSVFRVFSIFLVSALPYLPRMPDRPRRILLTVFETSGDVLAARLVTGLRQRWPGLEAFALGGPKLEAAGATLLEETTDHAAMGLGAVGEAKTLLRRKKLVRDWLVEHDIDALVPVDSPAANWSMCKLARRHRPDAKVVHLVAPQVWAWATWRVNWLRRLSDRVLCLLPFEPGYFAEHGVHGTFVGHPLFEKAGEPADLSELPDDGEPKLALLPGSRTGEVTKNWGDMLGAFDVLRHRYPKLRVVAAAADKRRADLIRRRSPGGRLPRRVDMVVGDAAAALDWADCAVVVSGTATLEAVSRRCPHVALFRASRWQWHTIGKVVIRTRTFTLPNLIAQHLGLEADADGKGRGHVVPELVPHFGGSDPVVRAIEPLLRDDAARERQREAFEAIHDAFAGVEFGKAAVDAFVETVEESG